MTTPNGIQHGDVVAQRQPDGQFVMRRYEAGSLRPIPGYGNLYDEIAMYRALKELRTVDDASIFIDDGISGAEFANRPGFLRLMDALKLRPTSRCL
jgi:hypothetical protein